MTTSNSHAARTIDRHLGRRFAVGLIASLVVALPHASFAQATQPEQPSAADLESARELFKEGREARQAGDLRLALDRFKAAHAYGQTPVTGLELGRTHVQLGELVEGREVLLSIARMKVQPDETDKSASARADAADLAEDLRKRIPTISVTLTGIASDADVQLTVDGFAVPVVGASSMRKVNPGKHVVVARVGAHEETREVEASEGETKEVAFDLTGASTAPIASAPVTRAPRKHISPVTWVGAGVGVLGLGLGTVAGILALGKASDVKGACETSHCPPSAKDDVDAGRTVATLSTVGFVVAGAGAITAALGYFVFSRSPAPVAFHVTPFVTGRSAGFEGSF